MARPTTYKPEYPEMLLEHMADGFTLDAFAGRIRVHRDTLHEWSKVHPEFSDAIKIGKHASQYKWEQKLQECVYDKGMNVAPVLFSLKTQHGFREVQAIEHSGPDGKPIEHKNLGEVPDSEIEAKYQALLQKAKESEVKDEPRDV